MADLDKLARRLRTIERAVLAVGRFVLAAVTGAMTAQMVHWYLGMHFPAWATIPLAICAGMTVVARVADLLHRRAVVVNIGQLRIEGSHHD